jgi:DNA-binding MarR family transcriptional regulator
MKTRQGANLALLLLGGFRHMAGAAQAELSRRGYPGITAANELAMRAIAAGASSASELARAIGVSKQAAAKVISALEERGYVGRSDDPKDARRKLVTVTDRGTASMQEGEAILDDLRVEWRQKIGADNLARLEADLIKLVGSRPVDLDAPGADGIGELDD